METNFLANSLLSAHVGSGSVRLNIPDLFATATRDEILDLPAVRPHQRQALHAFLAQLGGLALVAAGRREAPREADDWAALLRGLTPQWPGDEPWTLVVDDLAKPALLQPPVPEGTLDALKELETTPDALDMLVTSKNHDLKAARMAAASPEHWFLALLTLQTMQGNLGRDNYGVARMNAGFGSRPMVGAAPSGGWGMRLLRDIEALGADHDAHAETFGFPARGGKALLWLEPWDGRAQLPLRKLDPHFIEICRRVRLTAEKGGAIVARRGLTKAARVAVDKSEGGKTGDPWAPFDADKVLTVDGAGFHYRRVANLLNPAVYQPAPLQRPRREDGRSGLTLHFVATARGRGGTDGFHERRIPVPPVAAGLLGGAPDRLAAMARERVDEAGKVSRSVLKPALFTLFQNAPEQVNYRHPASETKAAPFLAAFDAAVDRVFFESLFGEIEAKDDGKEAARRGWLSMLRDFARAQLDAAEIATPRAGLRRQLAVVAARDALGGLYLHQFPFMKETVHAGP